MARRDAPPGRLALRGEGEFPRRTSQLQAFSRHGARDSRSFPLGGRQLGPGAQLLGGVRVAARGSELGEAE
jgi:hypothetical protein